MSTKSYAFGVSSSSRIAFEPSIVIEDSEGVIWWIIWKLTSSGTSSAGLPLVVIFTPIDDGRFNVNFSPSSRFDNTSNNIGAVLSPSLLISGSNSGKYWLFSFLIVNHKATDAAVALASLPSESLYIFEKSFNNCSSVLISFVNEIVSPSVL